MLNLKKLAERVRQPQSEQGQGLVEYALILVLVAIVVIAVLLLVGPAVGRTYDAVIFGLSGGQYSGPFAKTDDYVSLACTDMGLASGSTVYVYGDLYDASMVVVTTAKGDVEKWGTGGVATCH